MKVGGLITEAEFIRYNLGTFYRRPVILMLHVALGAVGLYWMTSETFKDVPPWSPIAVMAALFIFYRLKSQRLYRSNKILQSATTYIAMDDGLRIELPDITPRKVGWGQMAHLIDQPKYVVLYGAGNTFVIPKHWFGSHEKADEFLDIVREHTGLDQLSQEAKMAARKRKKEAKQAKDQSATGTAPLVTDDAAEPSREAEQGGEKS